mmetsp:Transcript_40763/g.73502  ORF Transcript_40763/g.73502 Transcript_40763/m.73502 type:complete len:208 (+) Transcript_40763:515-1138(+)
MLLLLLLPTNHRRPRSHGNAVLPNRRIGRSVLVDQGTAAMGLHAIIDLARVFSRDASMILPGEAADNLLSLLFYYLTLGFVGDMVHFVTTEGAGQIVVVQIFRHPLMRVDVLWVAAAGSMERPAVNAARKMGTIMLMRVTDASIELIIFFIHLAIIIADAQIFQKIGWEGHARNTTAAIINHVFIITDFAAAAAAIDAKTIPINPTG